MVEEVSADRHRISWLLFYIIFISCIIITFISLYRFKNHNERLNQKHRHLNKSIGDCFADTVNGPMNNFLTRSLASYMHHTTIGRIADTGVLYILDQMVSITIYVASLLVANVVITTQKRDYTTAGDAELLFAEQALAVAFGVGIIIGVVRQIGSQVILEAMVTPGIFEPDDKV